MLGATNDTDTFESAAQHSGAHDAESLLTEQIAARILDRLTASLDTQVSVATPSGRVLASTDSELVGARSSLARAAAQRGETVDAHEPEPGGVSAPLVFEDEIVGALVLHGDLAHGREILGVVKTLAELLVHQVYVVERVHRQEQLRSRFIADLLHGRAQAENGHPPRDAAIFGIDLRRPRAVAVVGIGDVLNRLANGSSVASSGSSVPIVAQTQRLQRSRADLIRVALESSGLPDTDAWGIVDDRWLALLAAFDPANPDRERDRIARRIERFARELVRTSGLDICAGLGRYHEGWPGLAQSFADATCAADAGTRLFGANRVYGLKDLGIAAFLTGASMSAKHELARSLLQPLEREPELLATVDVFLQHELSPAATVEVLHIHRHTLAYRLEKAARLIGLDPRKFQDAAQISAALLLRRMSDAMPAER
jgi:carbohydrate diacid regulator